MSGNNHLWLRFDHDLAYFILLLAIFSALPSYAITSQSFQVSATMRLVVWYLVAHYLVPLILAPILVMRMAILMPV